MTVVLVVLIVVVIVVLTVLYRVGKTAANRALSAYDDLR
jgi:hypothetical protein